MTNEEIIDYVEVYLTKKKIKAFTDNKDKKYIKMKESDFYNLCYKLVNLIDKANNY